MIAPSNPAHLITDIHLVQLNGRNRKAFKLYNWQDNTWVFAGEHTAPARTPKRRLIDFVAAEHLGYLS